MNEINNNDNNYINENNNDNDNEQLLLKQPLLSNNGKVKPILNNQFNSQFLVDEYDIYCESKFKIKKLLTLNISITKTFLFILLNIFTLGLINIIIKFFPFLKLYLLYKENDIEKSYYIGIYCEDGLFYVEKLIKNFLPNIEKKPLKQYVLSNIPKTNIIYTFIFKSFKYIYNSDKNSFSNISFQIKATEDEIIKNFWNGLSSNENIYQTIIYGKNEINIKIYNFFQLFINEFKNIYNIYIIASIIIWILNDYISYSLIILILFIIFLIEDIIEKKKNLQNFHNYLKNSGNVFVLQRDINNNVIKLLKNVNDLVPGDIYEIDERNNIIPCDSILIQGNLIMDESTITGEYLHTYKTALLQTNKIFNYQNNINNILYSGTKIIKIQNSNLNKDNPKALVIGTSFMTIKGNIIRNILYSEKDTTMSKFNNDIYKYILLLFILSFFGILLSYIFLLKMNKTRLILLLNIITILVPPILPICLKIGNKNSIRRLKKKSIKCINKSKINIAGTIDTILFETSGILSNDNIDFCRIQPIVSNKDGIIQFDKVYSNFDEIITKGYNNFKNKINNNDIINNNNDINNSKENYYQLFIECLACCNSLFFDDNQKPIGNLIDLKIFESSKWMYKKYNDGLIKLYLRPPHEKELSQTINNLLNENEENKNIKTHYEIGILKNFENFPQFKTMSVLAKNINEKNYKLFVKGSPEIMKELCDSNSIPDDYDDILNSNIKEGNQVIALACTYINTNFKNLEILKVEQFKKNLIFLGFIIIKYQIEENVNYVIQKLIKKKYKIILSTYKDMLSTINISRQSNIINPEDTIFTIELDDKNDLMFLHVDNYSDSEKFEMIEKFFEIKSDMKNELLDDNYFNEKFDFNEENENMNNYGNIELDSNDYYLNLDIKENSFRSLNPSINGHIMIIEGSTFEKIYLLKNKYLSTKDKKYLIYYNAYKLIIKKCRLFADMNSWRKMILIECLKEKDKENIICVCTNNINDYGTLQMSDVGLTLINDNNYSNISSPFINEPNNFISILNLLMEGKATLVTSFQIFKLIILYSFIQFFSFIILLYFGTFFTSKQFLVSNLFIIIPICYLISCTDTSSKTLSYHKLTGKLFNSSTYLSLLLQIILVLFFQLLSIHLLSKEKWNQKNNNYGYNNTIIFLMSNMQYLISVISFSITYPFKKNIFNNLLLILFLLFCFIYFTYMIVNPDDFSLHFLNLNYFPSFSFRAKILCICSLNLICSYLGETYLMPFIIFYYFSSKV